MTLQAEGAPLPASGELFLARACSVQCLQCPAPAVGTAGAWQPAALDTSSQMAFPGALSCGFAASSRCGLNQQTASPSAQEGQFSVSFTDAAAQQTPPSHEPQLYPLQLGCVSALGCEWGSPLPDLFPPWPLHLSPRGSGCSL